MAIQHTRLADPQQLDDSAAAIYTNPANKRTFVKLLWLYNTNSTPELVTIYYVPDSAGTVGTAGDTGEMFSYTLAGKTAFVVPIEGNGWILEDENDTVQAVSTTANKVNVLVCGGIEDK